MYHGSGMYIIEIARVFSKPLLKHTFKHKQERLQKGYGSLRSVFGYATSPVKSLKSKGIDQRSFLNVSFLEIKPDYFLLPLMY